MTSRRAPVTFSAPEYERVRTLVRERSGVELRSTPRPDLDRALRDALDASGLQSPGELCAYMSDADGVAALDAFLGAVTVQESHFFRSHAQFDALRTHVLPTLLASRSDSRRLRVWSAGCATGEEPYSLVILLEQLLPAIDQWDLVVLATDISLAALETAKRGLYRRWSFREVPAEIERRYFIEHGDRLEVIPRVRERVSFAPLNLARDRYPSLLSNTVDMDLILCRNVLIYFGEAVTAGVVRRLGDALADGGWLMLSQAEAGIAGGTPLEPRRFGGVLLHQKVKTSADRRVPT
jgi:chemotaxis protein methyltransferase CheR